MNACLNLTVNRIGGIVAEITRYDAPIVPLVSDIGNHLKITCGIVCSVAELHYLRVSPQEVQWITPYEAVVYSVESDTDWIVLTSNIE